MLSVLRVRASKPHGDHFLNGMCCRTCRLPRVDLLKLMLVRVCNILLNNFRKVRNEQHQAEKTAAREKNKRKNMGIEPADPEGPSKKVCRYVFSLFYS